MSISVIYNNGMFCASNVTSKHTDLLKKSGWKQNPIDGWHTRKMLSASLLRDYADDRTKNIINSAFIHCSPWKGALFIPMGLKALNHQPPSALYALSRNRSYLGLDPGLGKTIVAALIASAMGVRTLYICPPHLTLNTLEEFQTWNPYMSVGVLGVKGDWNIPDVLICPDSMIGDPYVKEYINAFKPQLLEVDEFHRYKTEGAKRTKALLGYRCNRKKKLIAGVVDIKSVVKTVVMSGTPIPNGRPIEMYTMLNKLAPQYIDFKNKNAYGLKYCNGFFDGYDYDFSGVTKPAFKELTTRMISKDANDPNGFMLRLYKDILKLPKLTEEIVILGVDMPSQLRQMDMELLRKYSKQDLMKMFIAMEEGKEDLHLATYKRLLGMHKVKPAVAFIKPLLEETEENLLIIGVHKEVIRELEDKLSDYSPLVITGDTPSRKRHLYVREYQSSKNKRLMIGNIDAIGLGHTLTKTNRIPLVEWSIVPGNNRQVIDRGHRYGLKHPLLAQYLAFRNSYDKTSLETLLKKQEITAYV